MGNDFGILKGGTQDTAEFVVVETDEIKTIVMIIANRSFGVTEGVEEFLYSCNDTAQAAAIPGSKNDVIHFD